MRQFEKQVVLVTGGTSGIGRAAAIAFAREGARVVVSGRREKEGAQTVGLINDAGGEGILVRTDVTSEADVKNLVEKTLATYGRLDVAFNNAGVDGAAAPTHEQTAENIDLILNANVKGVIFSMKHQIPALIKSGGGSIVNMASIAGSVGFPAMGVYVASKHAVIGLTKSAALEYAKQGVRVNAVGPAAIQTDMLDRVFTDDNAKQFAASLHPVGRIGTPDEVAAAVLFLASKQASFITGQTLNIDGGFLAQ